MQNDEATNFAIVSAIGDGENDAGVDVDGDSDDEGDGRTFAPHCGHCCESVSVLHLLDFLARF